MPILPGRAVELGITAEDLIVAEEEDVVSSPRRLPVVDSDSDVTKAMVSTRNEQSRARYKEVPKGFQELFFTSGCRVVNNHLYYMELHFFE